MPIQLCEWDGSAWQVLIGRGEDAAFVPGVTEPFYFVQADFGGQKNVGNRAGVSLTTYTGPIVGGIAQLSDGGTYENILFPCVVDLRNGEQLINCRVVVPASYTAADSIGACIRCLNGSTNTGAMLRNVEIHNRAQRPMNGVSGRNMYVYETVLTGCVDGFSDSTSGSAPQNWGYRGYDCVITEGAWWYSATVNGIVHPSDTQSHNDCIQKGTTLLSEWHNTVTNQYISEVIGTGTPGSGSDAGNTYVPASGYNFIATQAQMEAWRESLTAVTQPAGAKYGAPHRLPTSTSSGSSACVMVNRDGLILDHCYLAGAFASINLMDTNLPTAMNVTIRDCTFWNDMRNPQSRGSAKGVAIQAASGKTITATGNVWSDGTPVAITYI